VALGDDIAYLLKRAIPDALDPLVRRAVGSTIPRLDPDNRYRISYTGRFSSRVAADLLAFGRNQRLSGAIVVVDEDVVRSLLFRDGRVVGSDSNVLFERITRVLRRASLLEDDDADDLLAIETEKGALAIRPSVGPEAFRWAIERRAWEVAAALFFVQRASFVIVDGEPDLGHMEELELSPMDLALEGLRRYDEWRRGTAGETPPDRPAPQSRPPDAPATRPPEGPPADDPASSEAGPAARTTAGS
jgi:hypothetical protein